MVDWAPLRAAPPPPPVAPPAVAAAPLLEIGETEQKKHIEHIIDYTDFRREIFAGAFTNITLLV